jgi:carboxyl-terminal processing protease
MRCRSKSLIVSLLVLSWLFRDSSAYAQPAQRLSEDDRYRISEILRDAHDEVKKHYYDPNLRGLNWDARYEEFAAMVSQAHSLGEGFRVVAAFLAGLNDSHVFFVPPRRVNSYDDGYRFALVGSNCFITQIRPGSDAAAKLHIGDQIVTLDGYNVNREDYHDLAYFLRVLSPMPAAQLVLRAPDGTTRSVTVNDRVRAGKAEMDLTDTPDFVNLILQEENASHATRSRIAEMGDIAIWKLQRFDLDTTEVEHFIGVARKHKVLILDLRGNPGGSVDTVKVIVGSLFDEDIKICDRVERKDTKELIAKRQGNPFDGKLIVLIDAGSASGSELLARSIQLEHRGTVIGDKSAGAVMEAKFYDDSRGVDVKFFYGFSVTEANLIMTDGKTLEKSGVTPDELVLPTAADLAAGRDPVLARAVELAGAKLDALEAGKMFPFEWPPL